MADFLLAAWFVAVALTPTVLRGILRSRSLKGKF